MTPISQNGRINTHEEALSKIAIGAGINIAGKLLGGGLQYLYLIIVANILGIYLFGLFKLGLTIISLVGVISKLGMDGGVVKYVSLNNGIGDKSRVKGAIIQSLKYTFIVSIIMGAILFLIAEPLSATIFNKPDLKGIIKILSFSLPFASLMAIALAATQGFQIMKYVLQTENLFLPLSNIILTLIFFSIGLNLFGVLAAFVISILFASIISFYNLRKVFPDLKYIEPVQETGELFRFSIPVLFVFSFYFIIMWSDTLMLGYFRSSGEVGVYNAAMKTALLISTILVSTNSIFSPIISDLYNRKEIQQLENLFKSATKWIYTLTLPILLSILLFSKEIMAVFGQEFIKGGIPLIILACAQFSRALVGSNGAILVMSGKQDLMLYNTAGIALLNILLNYLLIPSYGILGASIASGVSIAIFSMVMLLEVYSLLRIHPYSDKILKIYFAGSVICGILFFMDRYSFNLTSTQKLLIYIPSFLTVFTWIIYRWGMDDQDRFILNVFKMKLLKHKP